MHRDPEQRAAFRRDHPCPSTGKTRGACLGYQVDHVKPLACGGADDPSNMQWLTKEANRGEGVGGLSNAGPPRGMVVWQSGGDAMARWFWIPVALLRPVARSGPVPHQAHPRASSSS